MKENCLFIECRPPDTEGFRSLQCKYCGRWIERYKGDHHKLNAGCPAPNVVQRPWQCGGKKFLLNWLDNTDRKIGSFRGFGDLAAWTFSAMGIKKRKGCKCSERQKWLNNYKPLAVLWYLITLLSHLSRRLAGSLVRVFNRVGQ